MTESSLNPALRAELANIYGSLLATPHLRQPTRSARLARRSIKTLLLMVEAEDMESLIALGILPASREVSA